MAEKRDYYDVLGIPKTDDQNIIKQAHRKLAKKYHPDLNKDKDSEEKFKEVQEAYETLSDPKKKELYDRYGHAGVDPQSGFGSGAGGFGDFGFSGFQGGGSFQDIFDMFTGGGTRKQGQRFSAKGQDRYLAMTIEFEEAAFGTIKTVEINTELQCDHCNGTGAATPNDLQTCSTCKGTGFTYQVTNTIFGTMQAQVPCPTCKGTGKKILKKCSYCNGIGFIKKAISKEINVPAGINNGQQIRVHGLGERGAKENGDLYIEIRVKPSKEFVRDGYNLLLSREISVIDAILGAVIKIKTLTGTTDLNIPAGTQDNTKFKIRGKGIKMLNRNENGDMYVNIKVNIPTKLSNEEKKLYLELQKIHNKK